MIRALASVGLLLCAVAAQAGTLRGQITLPTERVEAPDGLWRVENGVLPVTPRTSDARNECLLVVTRSPASKEPKAETVTLELRDLKLSPSLVAVSLGGTLQIKNEDRVPHTISAGDMVPPRSTPAGAARSERMQRPGIYPLRDEEMPHVRGWLIVTDGATSVRPDEHGAFHADLADGRYEVQLFYRGAFVLTRTVDVNAKTADLTLAVPTGAKP